MSDQLLREVAEALGMVAKKKKRPHDKCFLCQRRLTRKTGRSCLLGLIEDHALDLECNSLSDEICNKCRYEHCPADREIMDKMGRGPTKK